MRGSVSRRLLPTIDSHLESGALKDELPIDRTKHLLKIGVFAGIANTNLRTLRYYEEIGLLKPALRSDGGFRYYRPTDVHRVLMIQNLQQLGLQLDRIRELLGAHDELGCREHFTERVVNALRQQERLIDERIHALHAQKEKIAEAMDKLTECRTCEHCPTSRNNHCEPCLNTGESLPEFLSALY